MRSLVLLGSLLILLSCVNERGSAPPSLSVLPSTSSSLAITATTVGGIDEHGKLLILVTLANQGNERLVVVGGGADDDWFTTYDAEVEDGGVGGGHWISDGPVPGHISCPQPEYDLVVTPGNSIGRLQRVSFGDGFDERLSSLEIDVRLFLVSPSLRCGPLELVEREVDVALDEPHRDSLADRRRHLDVAR